MAFERKVTAMNQQKNIRRAALILAGGRSSRMGWDKPNLPFRGKTLLERCVDFWRQNGMDAVFVAAGQPDHQIILPEEAVPVYDRYSARGPLGGLHAAFSGTDAEFLWVCGVDMPFLTPEVILPEPEGDALVYRRNGRAEPLLGVYRRTALPVMEQMLTRGEGKLGLLLEQIDTRYIELPAQLDQAVSNVNTPEDYWRAKAGMPPMVGIAAWSGTGKTTFLTALIPELTKLGLTVAAVKHTHHIPGPETLEKDSFRLRQAGAKDVLLVYGDTLTLELCPSRLPPVDLILVEGFKGSDLPQIELYRQEVAQSLISREENRMLVMTDTPLDIPQRQLSLENATECAKLLKEIFKL